MVAKACRGFYTAAAFVCCALTAAAQITPPAGEELPVFRTETTLILAPFHVIQKNRYVTHVQPSDIEILEDGKPQKIAVFEGGRFAPRSIPVEIILLFDVSGSVMQEGLLDWVAFKEDLLDGLGYVSLGVYAFDSRLWRLAGPSRDLAQLKHAFSLLESPTRRRNSGLRSATLKPPPGRKGGMSGTQLYEAVIETARDMARSSVNASRMIVVFSDGFGTTDARAEDAWKVASELGVTVHPVVLGHEKILEQANAARQTVDRHGQLTPGAQDRLMRLQDKEHQIQEFASLAERTGGRAFDPRLFGPSTVRQILSAIVGYIRTEYVAGYTPQTSGQRRPHKVQVRLKTKGLGRLTGGARTVIH